MTPFEATKEATTEIDTARCARLIRRARHGARRLTAAASARRATHSSCVGRSFEALPREATTSPCRAAGAWPSDVVTALRSRPGKQHETVTALGRHRSCPRRASVPDPGHPPGRVRSSTPSACGRVARAAGSRRVERSFRMTKTDLAARPVFHRLRDRIEAHLTIVFAALAVSREAQARTGLSINKIVKTLRPVADRHDQTRPPADQRGTAHPRRCPAGSGRPRQRRSLNRCNSGRWSRQGSWRSRPCSDRPQVGAAVAVVQRLSASAMPSSATRPASRRATGMRNGEQET